MATVSESIPESLQPEVDAALAWFNDTQEHNFEVTGIVDAVESPAVRAPRELKLVLCGGETCQQRSFLVTATDGGFDVVLSPGTTDDVAALPDGETQAELDPPPGARRNWLASTLRQHRFVVLVFYRGFW